MNKVIYGSEIGTHSSFTCFISNYEMPSECFDGKLSLGHQKEFHKVSIPRLYTPWFS